MNASSAVSAAFLVSAIQMSCNARLALACRLFGSLFKTFAVCRVGRWRGGFRCEGMTVGRRLSPAAGVSVSTMAPSPASPHRTVRDVFRHTALREPSPRRHSALVHNASLQDVEARLLPEGAGRSPERSMSALMFIPQPTSELVLDIFVN